MKNTFKLLLSLAALMAASEAFPAQPAAGDAVTLKSDIGITHIPGIGLTLGNAEGYDLFVPDSVNAQPRYLPNPVVHLKPDSAVLVAVRLQDDYKASAQDAKPAEFQWSRTDGVNDWNVSGALIVDLYQKDGLFGTPIGRYSHEYNKEKDLAFKWTFGADWQKESGGDKPHDFQSYFAAFEMRPLGSERTLLKLGAVYERDAISGQNDWSYVLRVDPVWPGRMGVRIPFNSESLKQDDLSKLAGDPSGLLTSKDAHRDILMQGNSSIPGSDSFFIKPHMDLKTSSGGELKSIQDIGDVNFVYGVDVGLNMFADSLTLKYSFNGLEPISSGGKAHNYHQVTLRYTPVFDPAKWGDFSVFATYTSGEAPPAYVKHEQFIVGIGVKL